MKILKWIIAIPVAVAEVAACAGAVLIDPLTGGLEFHKAAWKLDEIGKKLTE